MTITEYYIIDSIEKLHFRKQALSDDEFLQKLLEINKVDKCSSCKENEAAEDHTCPYAEEINDDYESLCNCCSDCERQCCMDI